jgi:D-alanine transfer protein
MRNIAAFFTAAVLFIISAVGMHISLQNEYPNYSINYGTWINTAKFGYAEGLSRIETETDAIPVFGSSELRHGQKSGFHANTLLKDTGVNPLFIGKSGYQSLSHAITLGAMSDSLKDKKVVMIVSMQWLKSGGVKNDSFQSAFSEENFIEFLENENISSDIKEYVVKRAEELTSDNDAMNKKIIHDAAWYIDESKQYGIPAMLHRYTVSERSHMNLILQMKACRFSAENGTESVPDWEAYRSAAEEEGQKLCSANNYGMYDISYKKVYESIIKSGNVKKPSYVSDSQELQDMECFIEICRQNNIEPMLVIVPFNGYWYDFMGVDKEQREELYESVRSLAEKYDVTYADLSDNEYELYYFEDNSHPALKGLVDINEKIYEFCKSAEG